MTPRQLRRTMDLFDDVLRAQRDLGGWAARGAAPSSWAYPPANLYESPEGYLLHLEMPGVDPGTLDIQTVKREVTIAGERKPPELPEDASFHRRERTFGRFRRSFGLPEDIDSAHVEASYRDGVLEVRIPKAPSAKPRQIQLSDA